MRELLALFIPAVSVYIYIILSSIEYGVSLFHLFPGILKNARITKHYIQPVFEVTNVFLVFTIVSIFSFFPKANAQLGINLLVPIFLGLLFLGLRNVCMLLIFYGSNERKLINLLFFFSSFITPLLLSTTFIYMLTGQVQNLFFSSLTISLYCFVIVSILLITSAFFQFYAKEKKENIFFQRFVMATIVLFLLSFLSLLMTANITIPYIFSNTVTILIFYL